MATLYFSNQNVLVKNLKSKIGTIEGKIPSAASADNQLADKAYVDTSLSDHISSLTAAFNGSYATYADLSAATGMNKNDYAVVLADENNSNECWRYKYDGTAWKAEYRVNETALTTEQNNALNSGITAETVTNLSNIIPDAAASDNKLATAKDILSMSELMSTSLDTKINKENPTGTGNVSFNRQGDVGDQSFAAFGKATQLSCMSLGGQATGVGAIAIGGTSSGSNSLSLGPGSVADGVRSVSIGHQSVATGTHSVAMGYATAANEENSFSIGVYTNTSQYGNKFALGFYNALDTKDKFICMFGNGSDSTGRSNALALDKLGNLYIGGTVYINSDSNSENGVSLSDFIKNNSSLKFTGTLTTGDTILTFADTNIKEDMFINVYASQYGVMPDSVTVEAGKVTLTFDEALDSDVTFGIRLESFEANESTTTVTSSKPTTTA